MKFYKIMYPESFTQRVLFLFPPPIPDYLFFKTKSGITFLKEERVYVY